MNILLIVKIIIMNLESLLFVVAPLTVFVSGVLSISHMGKKIYRKSNSTFDLINDLEKKYIY